MPFPQGKEVIKFWNNLLAGVLDRVQKPSAGYSGALPGNYSVIARNVMTKQSHRFMRLLRFARNDKKEGFFVQGWLWHTVPELLLDKTHEKQNNIGHSKLSTLSNRIGSDKGGAIWKNISIMKSLLEASQNN